MFRQNLGSLLGLSTHFVFLICVGYALYCVCNVLCCILFACCVLFCVMSFFCVIVVPLPPARNPFAVNNK